MNKPLVYIIIVNFNGEEDSVECIKSLNRINYGNYKIVLVDNCSTTPITEKSRIFFDENSHLILLKENLGFAGGNNIGIKYAIECGAELVCLLNNDTEVEPDFLDILVEQYLKDKNVGIVGGLINYFFNKELVWYGGGHFDEKYGWGRHERNKEICNKKTGIVREVTFITGCLMLIPVSTIEKIGLLDESMFLYCEDTDYCCKVNKAGLKMIYCEDSKIYHKVNGSTAKINEIKYYYLIRNIAVTIRNHCRHKLGPYLHHFVYVAKNIYRKRVSLRIAMKALKDFRKKRLGIFQM